MPYLASSVVAKVVPCMVLRFASMPQNDIYFNLLNAGLLWPNSAGYNAACVKVSAILMG